MEEEDEAQDVSASLPKPLVETNKCNRLWDSSSTPDSDDEEMELIQVKLKEIASRLKKKDKKKKKVDCIKEAMTVLERNDKTPKPKLERALRLLIEGKCVFIHIILAIVVLVVFSSGEYKTQCLIS